MNWYVRTRLIPVPVIRLEMVTSLVNYITIVEVLNLEEIKFSIFSIVLIEEGNQFQIDCFFKRKDSFNASQ